TISRSEIIPRRTSLLVTTRAPTFFARNQSAALLMLASGAIVATSVPFLFKMLSTFMAVSSRILAEVGCLLCSCRRHSEVLFHLPSSANRLIIFFVSAYEQAIISYNDINELLRLWWKLPQFSCAAQLEPLSFRKFHT